MLKVLSIESEEATIGVGELGLGVVADDEAFEVGFSIEETREASLSLVRIDGSSSLRDLSKLIRQGLDA